MKYVASLHKSLLGLVETTGDFREFGDVSVFVT